MLDPKEGKLIYKSLIKVMGCSMAEGMLKGLDEHISTVTLTTEEWIAVTQMVHYLEETIRETGEKRNDRQLTTQ